MNTPLPDLQNWSQLDAETRARLKSEARSYLKRLDDMAALLSMTAQRLENSPETQDVTYSYKLRDQASAIKWATKFINANHPAVQHDDTAMLAPHREINKAAE